MNQTTTEIPSNPQAYFSDADLFEKPDISKLNGYYTDGDSCDQEIFSEMRSNVLLAGGDHYNKRQNKFYKRLRDSRELSQEQKLRLTKNHVGKICKIYANSIISSNPGVGFSPKDQKSMHDQKVADLHHSVWRDAHDRYHIDDKIDDWVDSFIEVGEVHVKLFYDPNKGDMKGFEPMLDADGNIAMDEFGQMSADETKPIFGGQFIFEEIEGFNLLRPPECKKFSEAEWLCIRKMMKRDELIRQCGGDEEKIKFITSDMDETYMVFDGVKGGYRKSSDQTMIREYYFRPSMLFPEGYFYHTTKNGILTEGELPGGLFPIVSALFDKIKTTPRGRGPIKTMRPYQAEINRSASKMAEHQITLGDDKLILQNGAKTTAGASLPGVRTINVTGAVPTILEGRNGSQYLDYMNSQITELYMVMNVGEDDDVQTNMDPYALLFQAAKKKKKFQRYIKRINKFLIDVCHLYLQLAKIHLPDDAVIMAVGKNEQVNIPEFRQLSDSSFEIKLEEQSDDIETKLGKQLVLNHALQYVGPNLDKDNVGKLLKQMPFANFDESFDDLTLDYDLALNDMLALDRGEQPPIAQSDNHEYMMKKLTARTRKPDFQFLPQNVKQNYFAKIALHQQFETAKIQAIQRAESGFIPSGGYGVTCDFYVEDPSDPTGAKTRRARVPYQALDWLIQQLNTQGQTQQQMQSMDSGTQTSMANAVSSSPGFRPLQNGQNPMPSMAASMPHSPGPLQQAPRHPLMGPSMRPMPGPAMGNLPGLPNGMGMPRPS